VRTFAESVEIAADPERVWRALCIPEEVVCSDSGVVEPPSSATANDSSRIGRDFS
jgi:hypothetical protein